LAAVAALEKKDNDPQKEKGKGKRMTHMQLD